jgi:hypothetical protein
MEHGCKTPAHLNGLWCRFHEDKNNIALRMEPARQAVAAVMPWNCDGFVYALQARTVEGPIKIGYSLNVQRRMASLAIASPVELELLGFIAGCQQLEQQLHRLLGDHNLKGEWFRPQHKVRQLVELIGAGDVFALANWIEVQKCLPAAANSVILPKIGFPSRFKWHAPWGVTDKKEDQTLY